VNERQIIPARRRRLHHVGGPDDAGRKRRVVDESILSGWKYVRPDIDLIPGRVKKFQPSSSPFEKNNRWKFV
jgi:hypothetical protein